MLNRYKNKSQYRLCLICESKPVNKSPICKTCLKNPFNIDLLRTKLSKLLDLDNFRATYNKDYPRILNKNSRTFWDHKFNAPEDLREQDRMTKDKIDTIITFLPNKISNILDLGIGQGYLEQRLEYINSPHYIYGIDISKKSIDRAKKKYKGKFTIGDILNIDKIYEKSFFDAIVAIEVIEHIPPTEIFELYRKIHSLLKPGGLFIISTPLNEHLEKGKLNPSAHLRQYSIPILKTEFKLAHFKIMKIKTFIAFKSLYTIKYFISKIFTSTWEANNVVILSRKTL